MVISDVYLTPHQLSIGSYIIQGFNNKKIAYLLKISTQTVKNNVSYIMRKLNVDNRTQIATTLISLGKINPDGSIINGLDKHSQCIKDFQNLIIQINELGKGYEDG